MLFIKNKKTQVPFYSIYPTLTPPDEVVNPIIPKIDEMVMNLLQKENIVVDNEFFEAVKEELNAREDSSYDARLRKQEKIENSDQARIKELEAEIIFIEKYVENLVSHYAI